MRHAKLMVILLVLATLLVACSRTGMRIRTYKKKKNRMENLKEQQKDSIPPPKPPDTLSKEVQLLKAEQFQFLTNLIINNMVRAQQAAYDGRYGEAEKLLLQTLNWYPTSDAYLLLGSVYEVQGRSREADSVWNEARLIDPDFDARTTELPRRQCKEVPAAEGATPANPQPETEKKRKRNR